MIIKHLKHCLKNTAITHEKMLTNQHSVPVRSGFNGIRIGGIRKGLR